MSLTGIYACSNFTVAQLMHESSVAPENLNSLPTPMKWSAKDDISTFEWQAEDLVDVGPGNALRSKEIGIMKFAEHMCIFGFAVIRGLPAQEGVLEDFTKLVAVIRDTNWGGIFNVENKAAFHNANEVGVSQEDIAYTNLGLPLHVDNPYREVWPSLHEKKVLAIMVKN